jgi:hypothetical protein
MYVCTPVVGSSYSCLWLTTVLSRFCQCMFGGVWNGDIMCVWEGEWRVPMGIGR